MNAWEWMVLIGQAEDGFILDAGQSRGKCRAQLRLSRTALIAAVLALALLLAGCAAVLLNLRSLRVGQWQPVRTGAMDAYGDPVPTEVPRDVLSLQGTAGSPNYLAAQEWLAFEESYDPGPVEFQVPEAYQAYNCYTQEMIDKVDEICAKYGLEPMGARVFDEDAQSFFEALGIRGVHKAGVASGTGLMYCYPGGSFYLEGSVTLAGTLYYGLRCSMKNVFDPAMLYLEDLEGYDQWNYTTSDGRAVLLARKDGHGLIIVDRADSFISVDIREYEDGDFGTLPGEREFLETVAETFDFSIQPQPVDMEAAGARMEAQLQAVQNAPKSESAQESERLIAQREASRTYGEYLKFYVDNDGKEMYGFPIRAEGLTWAERDMNSDGVPELIMGWNGRVSRILGVQDGKVVQLCDMGMALRLYEDNVFGPDVTQSAEEPLSYDFYRLEGSKVVTVQSIHYNAEKGSWYKMPEGDSAYYVAITEEEKDALVESFRPVEVDFRAVGEYPMG